MPTRPSRATNDLAHRHSARIRCAPAVAGPGGARHTTDGWHRTDCSRWVGDAHLPGQADQMKVTIELTETQEREYRACAEASGISIERWIGECAAVKAAAVIDAIQAPMRRDANASRAVNSAVNHRKSQLRRQAKQSETLVLAREYNSRFK